MNLEELLDTCKLYVVLLIDQLIDLDRLGSFFKTFQDFLGFAFIKL